MSEEAALVLKVLGMVMAFAAGWYTPPGYIRVTLLGILAGTVFGWASALS